MKLNMGSLELDTNGTPHRDSSLEGKEFKNTMELQVLHQFF